MPRRGRARRGVGGGERAGRRRASRPRRRGRHARPRQHAPPPVPEPDARPRAGGRPLQLAEDALPGVGRGSTTEAEYAAARTGLAELALSGCTTVFDHHYVFPRGGRAGCSRPRCRAARELGVRIVASRGSMDLGESRRRAAARRARRGPRRRARRRPSGWPGSPTAPRWRSRSRRARRSPSRGGLMRGVGGARAAARAAAAHAPRGDGRGGGVLPRALRLHAGRVPRAARLARRGRLVRALRPPLRSGRRARSAAPASASPTARRSNLRLGAGIAPVRELLDAGVRVGLGVDGSASNERGDLFLEVKQALLVARARGGPEAMTVRDALRLGTRGGAAVLGRDDIGSLEPGKRADLAVWRDRRARARRRRRSRRRARLLRPAPRRPALRRRRGGRARRPARPRRRGGDRARAPRARRKDSPRERLLSTHVLDTERGPPRDRRSASSSTGATSSSAAARPTPTAASRARRRARARRLPARLPPALAVLPPRRAGSSSSTTATTTSRCSSPPTRARPTAAADAPTSSRSSSRAHALRRAARASARTRSVRARGDRRSCREDEKLEALDAHPAIGARKLSARSAAEQGDGRRPGDARRARVPEPASTRRSSASASSSSSTGRPKAEILDVLRERHRADARRGARHRRSTSSSRSRRTGGAAVALDSVRDRAGSTCSSAGCTSSPAIVWIGTSFYFVALDNHLRRRRTARRERGVGGEAWEIHGGGFYRVAEVPGRAARRSPSRCTGSSGRRTRRG